MSTARVLDHAAVAAQFPYLTQAGGDAAPLAYLDSAATAQKPQVVLDAIATKVEELCDATISSIDK
jgi:selenocysteine lyase/cysteine desulfurase